MDIILEIVHEVLVDHIVEKNTIIVKVFREVDQEIIEGNLQIFRDRFQDRLKEIIMENIIEIMSIKKDMKKNILIIVEEGEIVEVMEK